MLFRRLRSILPSLREVRLCSEKISPDSPTSSSQYKNLIIEKSNRITAVFINRPSSRNSLDIATLSELVRAIQEFERDEDSRALVLAGERGNFSSGFDLKEVKEKGYDALRDAARPLLRRPMTIKPSVCAVSGFTVAEGLELALACDMRVVEDTAVLGFLGRRFGATCSMDGAARLASLVGLSRALDLTITCRQISGTTADEWGLAARAVATGTAVGQAINLATSLVKFPLAAIQVDKLSIYNSLLESGCEEYERNEAISLAQQSTVAEDVREGADKFEKEIGRHGKSYGLTPRDIKSWEREEDNNPR